MTNLKFEKVPLREINRGELFVNVPPEKFSEFINNEIGTSLFIRGAKEISPADASQMVYRVTFEN